MTGFLALAAYCSTVLPLNGLTENEQERLIRFLHKSKQYRPDRLLGKLPQDALPEIKAILLGRLGQHEKALKIYVYQLRDPFKAEAFVLLLSPIRKMKVLCLN